jgi:hypothetical protein
MFSISRFAAVRVFFFSGVVVFLLALIVFLFGTDPKTYVGYSRRTPRYQQICRSASTTAPPAVPVRSRLPAPLPGVTAVLLSWKRRENLLAVVDQLQNTTWVKEVLVWNNNPDLPLFPVFFGNLSVPLRVHNSPVNIKDEAKYRGCAMAVHDVCYYQDDDWDGGVYLEGLWRSFLGEPDHIHAATDPGTAFHNLHWTFYDAALGLHTGHSWIGCGALFRRAVAEEFLRKLDELSVPPEHRMMADCFFSLWQNQFPRVLGQSIVNRPADNAYSGTYDFLERQYQSQVYGIDIVRARLAKGEHWGSDHVQSRLVVHGYGGGSLFLTTSSPVDVRRALSWPADRDRGTRRNLPNYNEPYLSNGPGEAFGGNCWKGNGTCGGGYMLITPQRGRIVTLLTRSPVASMVGMQLWASLEGESEEWILTNAVERHREGRMVFELAQDAAGILAIYVRSPTGSSGEMSLCGFEIS